MNQAWLATQRRRVMLPLMLLLLLLVLLLLHSRRKIDGPILWLLIQRETHEFQLPLLLRLERLHDRIAGIERLVRWVGYPQALEARLHVRLLIWLIEKGLLVCTTATSGPTHLR